MEVLERMDQTTENSMAYEVELRTRINELEASLARARAREAYEAELQTRINELEASLARARAREKP